MRIRARIRKKQFLRVQKEEIRTKPGSGNNSFLHTQFELPPRVFTYQSVVFETHQQMTEDGAEKGGGRKPLPPAEKPDPYQPEHQKDIINNSSSHIRPPTGP